MKQVLEFFSGVWRKYISRKKRQREQKKKHVDLRNGLNAHADKSHWRKFIAAVAKGSASLLELEEGWDVCDSFDPTSLALPVSKTGTAETCGRPRLSVVMAGYPAW